MKDEEVKRVLRSRGVVAEGDGVVAVLSEDATSVKVILDDVFYIRKRLNLIDRLLRAK